MPDPIPTSITANRPKNQLFITFADGHESVISFALLREACPCAQCRGGHENMRAEPDPDIFLIPLEDSRKTQMAGLEGVGNYALKIQWADGHDYGLYNWPYLRALCECASCQKTRPIA